MESQNNGMQLNASALEFLRESAKWSKFLAIMGFIGIGFMVLAAIFMSTIMATLPNENSIPLAGAMKGFLGGIYLVMAALYFFPVYYLYKFSNDTKIALQTNNDDLLATGLGHLKSHYKYLGIMMIVILSLYALVFVGAIIFGIAAAASAA